MSYPLPRRRLRRAEPMPCLGHTARNSARALEAVGGDHPPEGAPGDDRVEGITGNESQPRGVGIECDAKASTIDHANVNHRECAPTLVEALNPQTISDADVLQRAEVRIAVTLNDALACALAAPSWAEEADKPTIVPVTKAPFHLFTFQDENMSLENVTLPPGRSTGYHLHEQDLVYVITAGAKITNQVLGKEPVELEFKLGEVRFANYTKTPGVHRINNLETDNTLRILAVGIVYAEPGRYTVSTRPEKYEVALDNERVRTWRLKLNPGESAPVILQTAPGARFVVAGGTVTEKRPGKPDQPMVLNNHDFVAMPAEERSIENNGNSAVELVEIELK